MVLRVPAINTVSPARIRAVIAILMLMVLASCASNGAREAEIAIQEAEVVAASEASARAAEEAHRESVARMNRQKEEQEAEQVRLQARRDKEQARRLEVEAEKIKEQETQMLAVKAEQQARQAREQKIAAAAARRQAKIERITELESLISRTENNSGADEASVLALNEAINVAEDLLDALAAEQTKYENTDATGNTVEPLAKSLIAELESRKNDLVSRSFSQ
ncbi:MAG: colicin import membrane protein [Pseudohongiellaceae bacterium]|jgi:colicin import membrane protein